MISNSIEDVNICPPPFYVISCVGTSLALGQSSYKETTIGFIISHVNSELKKKQRSFTVKPEEEEKED